MSNKDCGDTRRHTETGRGGGGACLTETVGCKRWGRCTSNRDCGNTRRHTKMGACMSNRDCGNTRRHREKVGKVHV